MDRPTILLPQAIRIEVESPDGQPTRLRWRGADRRVIACSRPERIVLPWWKLGRADLLSRDYFTVQDEQGRWLWIYRYNPTGWWYLHGHWA